jgi:hypothetical protein
MDVNLLTKINLSNIELYYPLTKETLVSGFRCLDGNIIYICEKPQFNHKS